MCAFGDASFIYVSYGGGSFCEMTNMNGEYMISFKTKEHSNDFSGNYICTVNCGKYIISSNKHDGCSIFNYAY